MAFLSMKAILIFLQLITIRRACEYMSKPAIKVVKRDKRETAEKLQPVADASKTDCQAQLTIVNAVENWISERCANRLAERIFTDDKILEWKIASENFK